MEWLSGKTSIAGSQILIGYSFSRLSSRSGLSTHSPHNVADESPKPKAGLITQISTRYILNTRFGGWADFALLVAIKEVWKGQGLGDQCTGDRRAQYPACAPFTLCTRSDGI
jgi:hypothetical protein